MNFGVNDITPELYPGIFCAVVVDKQRRFSPFSGDFSCAQGTIVFSTIFEFS